jgi:hypothetical protein
MDSLNFWLGAILVVWWASREFQSPYAAGYVRDRTDAQRYVLGLIVFVLGAWMAYLLLWNLTRRIHDDFGLLERISGLSAVAATVIVLPTLPLISAAIARFRRFSQDLAGFPKDVDGLILNLRRPLAGKGDVADNFNARLHEFGFSLRQVKKYFSQSCMASILEAQRMQDKLAQCQYGEFDLVEPGRLGHSRGRYRAARLRRYLHRRHEAIARLDSEYFELLHRAARVVKLADDSPLSERQLKQLSAFLADQAENLIARYQKLVAQTALAVFPPGRRRLQFLEYLGYTGASTPSLPLWPIVAVLAIDILTSGIGFAVITYGSSGTTFYILPVVIFAHGLAMTAAVFWAIAPKVMWAWARPSLTKRPFASYVVFGLVSYGCGFFFFVAALFGFGWSSPETSTGTTTLVLAMVLLPPGLFAVTNVVLSWRIDHRIIRSSHRYGWSAARDAFSLIVATFLFSLFFRKVGHAVGMPLLPPWKIWPVLGITALVIGFAIPGWAARYIYPSGSLPNNGSVNRYQLLERTLADDAEIRADDAKIRA